MASRVLLALLAASAVAVTVEARWISDAGK